MNKITIIGAGNVGATTAHLAALKKLGDIVLIEAGMDKKVAAAIATIVKERIKKNQKKSADLITGR